VRLFSKIEIFLARFETEKVPFETKIETKLVHAFRSWYSNFFSTWCMTFLFAPEILNKMKIAHKKLGKMWEK
jgi:hypothetical protein